MKILFLDDMSQRHDLFEDYAKGVNATIVHVFSAKSAIKALEASGPFDVAFLDHDLGDTQFAPTQFAPSDEKSGYAVAQWIAAHPESIKDHVIIHSYNPAGAKNMVMALIDSPFDVVAIPFGPSLGKWLEEESKVVDK